MAPKAKVKAAAKAAAEKAEKEQAEKAAAEKAATEKTEAEKAAEKAPEPATEEAKEPETDGKADTPKEPETDAATDTRPVVKADAVKLNFEDSTLNAMPVAGGKILMSLSEGGMQHLLAGIRCNTAVKAGRYMFEMRILESLNPTSDGAGNGRAGPRQLVRLGVSLAGSSVFLGDGPSNCCFDSDGFFLHDRSKKKLSQKFVRDQTVALVLNLDSSSPCANTMSLFVNGNRAGEPVPLPENLVGKPLIPTVTYRNVSVELNFGPMARSNMPFSCRMIGAAATADVEVAKPKTGTAKPEVVFPVGLPDQGYFHWVDQFMEKNPGYTELSDRKILEWAAKSGMWTQQRGAAGGSNDKPEARFGIPSMDDWSVSRVIAAIAPTTPRNYVLPELKANLVASDRENALLKFGSQDFKRKAVVMMGDPDQAFKDTVLAKLLEEKTAKVEAESKRKAAEEERKKQAELRKQKAIEARKAAEEARKKRMRIKAGEEVEDEEMKGDEEGKEEDKEEGKEEEAKEEEPKEEEAKEEEPKEEEAKEAEDVKMDDAPVELTEEEKSTVFPKTALPDLTERELAMSYASFSLPSKAEGFDDIAYAWQTEKKCAEHMKAWVMEKKLTNRAEDLTPGTEFKEAYAAWQKKLQEWRKAQQDFKDPARRKAVAEKKAEEAKKKLEEDKNTMIEAGDEEGAKKAGRGGSGKGCRAS